MRYLVKRLAWIKEVWSLVKPYWQSSEKNKGLFWLFLILANSVFSVYMSVWLNEWNGLFYNTIQNYDKVGFLHALVKGSFIMSLYVFVMIIGYYFSSILEINWRKWLTNHYLQQWFQSKAYYHGRFVSESQDNPDQRISEDIHQFIQLTLRLFIDFFHSCLTLGSFVVILWKFSGSFKFTLFNHQFYIPGYMVWMAILYAIIGTYITFKIGNPLIKLNYQQQKYEADFRYNLVRVREYAEQVASYSGEEVEHKVVTRDFDNIVDNFMASVRRNLKINLFNYGYGQLSTIMPTIISAGRYFSKQITLGDMMQINSAFMRVEYSIAYFIYIYSDIANLRSIMNRLHGFNKMIDEINATQMVRINHSQDYYLKITDLQIETPDKRILIESFSMQADIGDRVLIQGNSGIGKSTLLRTLNHLWPYASGNIYYKPGLKSLFISQKPYLPKVNLKEAICYPKAHNLPSDNEVSEILIQCKLASLVPQLYLIHDWGNHLSLGEQQKLIFARVIINRPDIVYLDEVTSFLDERSEAELYPLLNKVLPNSLIISIGHKSSLTQFHNQVINL